jgi:hypothetical protein
MFKNYFAVIQEKGTTYYNAVLYKGTWKEIKKFMEKHVPGLKYNDVQTKIEEKNQIYSFSKHVPHGFFSISADFDLVVGKLENWKDEIVRQGLVFDEAHRKLKEKELGVLNE